MSARECDRCNNSLNKCTCKQYKFRNGGSWLFHQPQEVPARWGEGSDILWARGEALLLTGSPGTGKTTIAGQLVRALLGLQDEVLGFPVVPATRVLYLAMDRPRQIARALARPFRPEEQRAASAKLDTWEGPPPVDLAQHPEVLRDMAQAAGADVIIVDSLKDAAVGLVEDEVGAGWNRARQTAIAAGIDVLELHHLVKRGANGSAPSSLAEVYGSTWITSGAGSVLVLIGEAGDALVEMRNLKPVMETVGPLKIEHDHTAGVSRVVDGSDPLALLRSSPSGITATELAGLMNDTKNPTANQKERARRKLERLCSERLAELLGEVPAAHGGRPQKRYGATTRATTAVVESRTTTALSTDHAPGIPAGHTTTEATTATTHRSTTHPTTPVRGGVRRPSRSRHRDREVSGPAGARTAEDAPTSSRRKRTRKSRSDG
ncbi:AAA family ATPase [Brachybacterium sp. Z12]|uniref:AAA family ATPase n=1 Tax=Brachybacterium sp. Z12 TaxID=2759167 RepID=UPI0018629CD9|nr:AAA family ATPase [Brachybacterium sp. Z12]QNN81617.1 AAA family ATPase [Brachybacterium sp. Z12]